MARKAKELPPKEKPEIDDTLTLERLPSSYSHNNAKIIQDLESVYGLNTEIIARLCRLQCTIAEVSGFFNCTGAAISRYIYLLYGISWTEYFEIKRQKGLISLRRKQFRLANDSASMAIFLGKNYLGQSDQGLEEVKRRQEIHEANMRQLAAALQKTEAEIERIKRYNNPEGDEFEDDGFMDALDKSTDIWKDKHANYRTASEDEEDDDDD